MWFETDRVPETCTTRVKDFRSVKRVREGVTEIVRRGSSGGISSDEQGIKFNGGTGSGRREEWTKNEIKRCTSREVTCAMCETRYAQGKRVLPSRHPS